MIQSELPGDWKPDVGVLHNERLEVKSKELEQYKKMLKLTQEQRQVLVGILLGDAHMETRDNGQTYRLKVEQSEKHRLYVQHLYELFSDWVRTPPQLKDKLRNGVETRNVWFQTLSHGAFRFYAGQFCDTNSKRVPKLIHRWLTPRSLAYWFMDDGSTKSSQSKAMIFNTQGFSPGDVARLAKALESKFGLEVKPRKQKDGLQLYVSGRSYETLLELIEPFIIDDMKYKLPPKRKRSVSKQD